MENWRPNPTPVKNVRKVFIPKTFWKIIDKHMVFSQNIPVENVIANSNRRVLEMSIYNANIPSLVRNVMTLSHLKWSLRNTGEANIRKQSSRLRENIIVMIVLFKDIIVCN